MQNIQKNIQLNKYSWFNLGGKAEYFFKPNTIKELKDLFLQKKFSNDNINFLGAGSNTLIRDGILKGLVIKLGPGFSFVKIIEENMLQVGAATLDKTLSIFALNNSIEGFEFLSCIPGSIGGAIIMNSGCYNEQISDRLLSIEAMNSEGKIIEIKKQDLKFTYRNCDLNKKYLILSAKFSTVKSDKSIIKKKMEYLVNKKKNDQPSQIKTCGSTFKNPPGKKAWEIIKLSGCDKIRVGNASISPKHSNFFINNNGTRSSEVEELIKTVQKKVFEKTGIRLELEIKILGNSE